MWRIRFFFNQIDLSCGCGTYVESSMYDLLCFKWKNAKSVIINWTETRNERGNSSEGITKLILYNSIIDSLYRVIDLLSLSGNYMICGAIANSSSPKASIQ